MMGLVLGVHLGQHFIKAADLCLWSRLDYLHLLHVVHVLVLHPSLTIKVGKNAVPSLSFFVLAQGVSQTNESYHRQLPHYQQHIIHSTCWSQRRRFGAC